MTRRNEIELYYKIIKEGFTPPPSHKRLIRSYQKSGSDPLEKPLREAWRCYYPESDYESMYEYGICKLYDGDTDEDIKEYVKSLERHNTTPYDCSGKMVTCWITWKRTPVGLAIVHRMTLDV